MGKQSKTDIVEINQAVVKKGRGGRFNFPNAIDPETEDSETIRSVLTDTLRWYDRGQDRPTTDDGIYERSREFLQDCMTRGKRPTVENYCLAIGYARNTVTEWKNGMHCSANRSTIIKNVFDAIAAFDAGLAAAGKMNPVLYFFRAKNYYGMRDQQDITVEARSGVTDQTAADVVTKYAQLPDD